MKANITIFDYLKDILVNKTGNLPLDNYVPYMINRWLSFINPQISHAINQANTKVLLEDKSQHYKLLLSLFPKLKYAPKIQYIKKSQEEKEKDNKEIKFLASQLEVSEKEVSWLIKECSTLDIDYKYL